jgi:hypothetical protein
LDIFDAEHGDLASSRFLWIDGGKPATGRAVAHEPASATNRLEGFPAQLAAHPVEDNVEAETTGRLDGALGPARFRVVDDHVGAGVTGRVQLGPAACCSDNPGTGLVSELHGQNAETAARRRDQNRSSGLDLGHLEQPHRRSTVVLQRGSLLHAQSIGNGNQLLGRDHSLHTLYSGASLQTGELTLSSSPGIEAYDFTFG